MSVIQYNNYTGQMWLLSFKSNILYTFSDSVRVYVLLLGNVLINSTTVDICKSTACSYMYTITHVTYMYDNIHM